ncbi:hypothetical protein GCM10027063_36930 [Promicromonospora xylanilytica]
MLTAEDCGTFKKDGMLVRRNLLTQETIRPARELIDDWCARNMSNDRIEAYTQKTFAPEHGQDPRLLNLFNEPPILEHVKGLLGDYLTPTTVQIQIRLPEDEVSGAQPVKHMHVDGVATPHLAPDELRTFSLLVGVVLSSITDPDAGALRYVEGGHEAMSKWFRDEWSIGMAAQVPEHINTLPGTPFLAEPGDVLFMHHLVPHRVGINTSKDPRVMAYFRVSHTSHAARRVEALRDPWLDFEPVQLATVR